MCYIQRRLLKEYRASVVALLLFALWPQAWSGSLVLASPPETSVLASFFQSTGGVNSWSATCRSEWQQSINRNEFCDSASFPFSSANGVTCSSIVGNVIWLTLSDCGLTGEVSGISFHRLTSLQRLDLSHNSLNGSLPMLSDGSSELATLNYLDLSRNQFSGTLPSAWALAIPGVEEIRLSGNGRGLHGNLPNEWSSLHSLTHLDLSNHSLVGTLPDAWGEWASVTFVGLSFNMISGSLPSTWPSSELEGNFISGALPSATWAAPVTVFGGSLARESPCVDVRCAGSVRSGSATCTMPVGVATHCFAVSQFHLQVTRVGVGLGLPCGFLLLRLFFRPRKKQAGGNKAD